jgi:exonuclease VII small subunit
VVQTKHETVLSYKADARGLKELARELKRTFEPGDAKAMNRAYLELQRSVKSLAKEQARLNIEMMTVEKGTEAYEALEKALASVEKRYRAVGAAARAIAPTQDPAKGAFLQGLLQGVSPGAAGFLQRGPGMRAQFAGQQVGRMGVGAVRGTGMRIGGAMTGGGSAALFAGIPGLGGLAQMAAGAVGQAVEREQAIFRGLLTSGGGGFAAARAARASVAVPGKLSDLELAAAYARGVRNEEETQAYVRTPTVQANNARALARMERRGQAMTREEFEAASLVQGREGLSPAERAAKAQAAGERERSRLEQVNKRERSEARQEAERLGRAALRAPFEGAINAGALMGMNRTQSIQQATDFARTIGGGIPGQTTMENIYGAQIQGVEAGTSARLLRQMRRGRGGAFIDDPRRQGDVIAGAISDALVMGLEGSEVNEHLSRIAQLQESAEQQGIKLSNEGIGGFARAFSVLGASGPQAGRLAQQFAGAGQRIAARGAQGPMDLAMMRAFGFRPGTGAAGYVGALEAMETLKGGGGMPGGQLFDLLQNVIGGVRGTSEEAEARRKLALVRSFGSMGVTMGFGQAGAMSNAFMGGRGSFESALAGTTAGSFLARNPLMDPLGIGGNGAGMRGQLREIGPATALQRSQAAVADQLVVAGQKVASLQKALDFNAAKLAGGIGDLLEFTKVFMPVMNRLTNWLTEKMSTTGQSLENVARSAME